MDHTYAETHAVADLYLTDRLSDAEREAFEDHFVGCAACLDRLDATEDLVAGLKADRAVRASARTASRPSGRLWRVAVPALAAGIVLAGALALVESAGKRTAERALDAARREAAASRDALASERNTAAALAEEVKRLASPGEAAVFTLEATRGSRDDGGPVNRIALPSAGEVILLVDRPRGVRATLRGRIAAAGGRTVGEVVLHPASDGMLAVTVPAGALGPGDYVLELRAAAGASAPRPLASYGFRVEPRP